MKNLANILAKITTLDELFEVWKEWIEEDPEQRGTGFAKDGIICPSEYKEQKQNQKLLFLCKEPNAEEGALIDFPKEWRDPKTKKYRFGSRICQWAYGIQNKFPGYDFCKHKFNNNEKRTNIMKSIAFMNLKKTAGDSEADRDEIRDAVETQRDFILKEIDIINPGVIIFSGYPENLEVLFGEKMKHADSGYDAALKKVGACKIIHFWHPSCRYPNTMLYAHLKCVYQSDPFKNL